MNMNITEDGKDYVKDEGKESFFARKVVQANSHLEAKQCNRHQFVMAIKSLANLQEVYRSVVLILKQKS